MSVVRFIKKDGTTTRDLTTDEILQFIEIGRKTREPVKFTFGFNV